MSELTEAWIASSLALLAMTSLRVPAARNARVMHRRCPPGSQRAQGMPVLDRTRSLACNEESTQASHHRHAETVRHSLRDGVTAYTCSPRCAGLVSHRRPGEQSPPKLDLSVGRSGPHDFAVRAIAARPRHPRVHRILFERPRRLAKRPSSRIRMRRDNHTFRKNGRKIFGEKGS